ncbi:MAG: pyridoxal-phosphate-dependent aminotransferase family protein [Lachnospiraceae bacterium]
MINFTIGPVQSNDFVREIGGQNVPYFRTLEFSGIMLESEYLMKKFAFAAEDARVVFITGSGTASMEAAVVNAFSDQDKVLIVNGGSFGARFVEICEIHKIPHEVITLGPGADLTKEHLEPYEASGLTGFLVNLGETTTGVLYDLPLISDFCKRNRLFLIVDAISAFMADAIQMDKYGIDMLLTGSQKALACPPGVSIIVMGGAAVKRVNGQPPKCLYLDLKSALKNMERGQTPFTPAVGTLLQVHARLKQIEADGGVVAEQQRIARLADHFRRSIKDLPLTICARTCSNAVTALITPNGSAHQIFTTLKDEYDIWVCPNGGELAETVFRVGHIGDLMIADNEVLIKALQDLVQRGILSW